MGSALLDWLTGGSALAALGKMSLAVSALVLGLIYRRYLGILGADRRRPAERQAYDALRNILAEGNLPARLYAERLTRFLDWIDRYFGDAGMTDRTLFPHAFGLKTPAPLWTVPAFDRCLLLAFIYPFLTIFLIWTISGHVGPAETALRFKSDVPGWQRAIPAGVIAFLMLVLSWRHVSSRLNKNTLLTASVISILIGSLALARTLEDPASNIAIGVTCAFAWLFVTPGVAGITIIIMFCLLAPLYGFLGLFAPEFGKLTVIGIVSMIAVALGAVFIYQVIMRSAAFSIKHGRLGSFFMIFILSAVAVCMGASRVLSSSISWKHDGPLILFLGLLPLTNAPFDWVSLGLTRALLRRGLELGGWWPYALALVDACLAALIIAALALTILVGVQAFDALAVHGGGTPVLPLDALFNGIAARPSAPEYWWIYALLLSTMIPSLVNLVIGGTSLLRGLPGLPSLLLRKIPTYGNVPKFDRAWIATVLTAQVAAGAALGIAMQIVLVVVIIGYVMPFVGLELLNMARDVAAFDLPARVGQLFGVSL